MDSEKMGGREINFVFGRFWLMDSTMPSGRRQLWKALKYSTSQFA